ncbi:MAG: GntR family transcriptional regulator [Candidatus Hydrogenedentota bacterium]
MLSAINIHSSVPVYEQIENHVQFAIASNTLKEGDRLPSVKELAERLGVNFNTVAKSYRDLEVMGLIFTRRGMGCFIKKGLESRCKEQCRTRIIKGLHEVVQEAKAAGIAKKDLTEVVNKSFAADAELYGEVPAEVLALAKKKTK